VLWNTKHPHVHVIMRGKGDVCRNLVISRDYISHGLRSRAKHRVTLELAPRIDLDVRQASRPQIEANRWTKHDSFAGRRSSEQ
jgi:type IV secretory pathway VirD2 relaxase